MEKARQLCEKKKHGISGGLGKDVTAMRRPEECLWKKPDGSVRRKTREHRSASGACDSNATAGRVLMEEARRHCLKENARTPVSFGRVWRQRD